MTIDIRVGDALTVLKTIPDQSVQCCVTSPPYFGLRDYGTGHWIGGDADCEHRSPTMRDGRNEERPKLAGSDATNAEQLRLAHRSACGKCGATKVDRQLGLEKTPQLYVDAMVGVFAEVRRVLRDDGTVWLNLGDSYASIGHKKSSSGYGTTGLAGGIAQQHHPLRRENNGPGLKHKDLIGIPWLVAFALRADGWYLRSDIIWHKPNPMPESVTDRPTKAHEYVFLLSKSARYFYDADAIRTALQPKTLTTFGIPRTDSKGNDALGGVKADNWARSVATHKPRMKMPDGWDTGPGAHGSYHRDGREKGKKALPETQAKPGNVRDTQREEGQEYAGANARTVWTIGTYAYPEAHFATFPPALIEPCILAGSARGDTILDPFGGAGTTGLVADRLGRNALLIELNPKYAEMARRRIRDDAPLFHDPEAA